MGWKNVQEKSPNGKLTFAYVDGPNDVWFWAIVSDYKGPQEYGALWMAFAEGEEPTPQVLRIILAALEN